MQAPIGLSEASPKRTRRSFSRAFKRRLVDETKRGDRSVAEVALAHRLNANLLHRWIRLARDPGPAMLPVAIVPEARSGATASVLEIRSARGVVLSLRGEWDPMRVAALVHALG